MLRQQEASSHLRLVIRRLMAERAAGGDAESASAAVEALKDLSVAERLLLRRRMVDLVDRAQTGPPVVPVLIATDAAPDVIGADPPRGPLLQAGVARNGNGNGHVAPGAGRAIAGNSRPTGGARRPISDKAGLGAAGVQSVLQALSTKARELLHADICQVYLEDGDLLALQAESPDKATLPATDRLATGRHTPERLAPDVGFPGIVRAAGRAMTVDAVELSEGSERAWIERGACQVAAVPVGAQGDAGAGMLVALRVTPRPFTRDDLVEMAQLADEVTLAMASADLLSRAEELAVLKERMNLAREIHDGLASDLSAVVQMFKYHEHRRKVDPGDADALLLQMRELVEGALQSARDILSALRPRQQTPRRLAETIKQLVEAFSRTYGVSAVTRTLGDDASLVAEEREAIFQVARESLTNIRKHSQCSTLEVSLDMTRRPFVLVVEDDGVGIDLRAADDKTGSFGLLGMRERAQLLGGTLDIGNGVMGGARLEFHGPSVPLGA